MRWLVGTSSLCLLAHAVDPSVSGARACLQPFFGYRGGSSSTGGWEMAAAVSPKTTVDDAAWHAIAVEEVVRRLATSSEQGLPADEAAARLRKYGPNRLPEGRKQGPLMRFVAQFNNILVYVLLGAGFTKMMLGLWIDAAVILGVVVINSLLGFVQEGRAGKALGSS